MNTPSLSVSSSATANGASSPPPLPRFLVRQSPYRHWYIWDSLLGQTVGREYDTRAQAMQGIEDRFSITYGIEVVE